MQTVLEAPLRIGLKGSEDDHLNGNAFDKLVSDLSNVLGPSSGLDSDDVDPADITRLMEQYQSDPSEWLKFAFGDPSRAYTRNLVDKGNGKSNLLVLVWTPGKASPIHDHANSHCVMKVLRGVLQETLYHWPEASGNRPLSVKRDTIYQEDQVTYMSDKLGLHKISNPDPINPAVSLHLYTPPNAAKIGCHMFNEMTGAAVHTYQCQFFSEFGSKLPNA